MNNVKLPELLKSFQLLNDEESMQSIQMIISQATSVHAVMILIMRLGSNSVFFQLLFC